MIYNKRIEVIFSKEDELILDGQSKICNWLYNQLLSQAIDDYKNNSNLKKLTSGRNLRDLVPKMKKDHAFLKTVHSSPLKNTALRLKDAYDRFFKKQCGYPKFRSFKEKWFSLYYDEKNKGFKLLGNKTLRISLGKNIYNKQMHVIGSLRESLKLANNAVLKTFRLCRQEGNRFYAIFTIESETPAAKAVESWIAVDQNHKNFFVAVDNQGRTFEFLKLYQDKYFDRVIDSLKSKRDLCNKKHKQHITTVSKATYYIPNRRYVKLNKALNKAYARRREQIKSIMYAVAHFIAKNYDKVIIGDYVPSKSTAVYDNMHRSMLNQAHIGEFRKILEWVMTKSSKSFIKVAEKDTTKICCVCGDKKKKTPDIREFTCKKCNSFFLRDVNSTVNIAKKVDLVPNNLNLDKIDKVGTFIFKQQRLMVI